MKENSVSKIGNLYKDKKHQSGDVYSIGGVLQLYAVVVIHMEYHLF